MPCEIKHTHTHLITVHDCENKETNWEWVYLYFGDTFCNRYSDWMLFPSLSLITTMYPWWWRLVHVSISCRLSLFCTETHVCNVTQQRQWTGNTKYRRFGQFIHFLITLAKLVERSRMVAQGVLVRP